MNVFSFLAWQWVWIPSGAVVTDGLDSGRCMERYVVVEDSAAGAQDRCRLFSQDNRLSDDYCSCETKIPVHSMLSSHVPQMQ